MPGPAKATPDERCTSAISSDPAAPCPEHRDATKHAPLERKQPSAFPPMQSNAALSRRRARRSRKEEPRVRRSA